MWKTTINRALSTVGFAIIRTCTMDRFLAVEGDHIRSRQLRDNRATGKSQLSNAQAALQEVIANPADLRHALQVALKDITIAAQFNAAASSAQWLYEHADRVPLYSQRTGLLDAILPMVPADGDIAEFGVFTGAVTRFVRPRFMGRKYHAFDSFRGVPEAMSLAITKYSFDLEGVIPDLPNDTTIHAGWFEDTVPKWRAQHPGPVAFAYIDCDLYESVCTVLEAIADRLRPGSILAFDDWYNFPNWRAHSLRATNEFVEKHGIRLEPIGFCVTEHAGAFRVTA